jgi:hypothetical protein
MAINTKSLINPHLTHYYHQSSINYYFSSICFIRFILNKRQNKPGITPRVGIKW